ncbi:MAG: hypothetical protein IJ064_05940 [Bacteroidaceae bacterium]|nr:hypothetical protein [Bacteroidaceae bacterium]
MRSHLGDGQAEALFRGLQEPPTVAVRFNRCKLDYLKETRGLALSPSLCDAVPWCPDAYYLPERYAFTFDPLFHAGVYYVQDASSMYLAEVLRKYLPLQTGCQPLPTSIKRMDSQCPLMALDLCAAPGGKSTLLATHLPKGSLLVSNEPLHKRAQVLAENLQKWCRPIRSGGSATTAADVLVTQEYPQAFSHLRETFDLLLADVPCSGEGMFRKDEQAVCEWSLGNVRQCAERQREILQAILPTLKPGGLLIYSTCTFNRWEDEEQVQWLQATFGLRLLEERHFFPGRDRGEGLYMSVLQVPGDCLFGDVSEVHALKRKVFRTLHVMADATDATPYLDERTAQPLPQLELSYIDAIAYLRHEGLHLSAPRGILVVTYEGLPLGLAKGVGNRLNNLYPSEWRIRTTYSPADSLPPFFV